MISIPILIFILILILILILISEGVFTQLHDGRREGNHDINTNTDIDIDIDIRRSFHPVAGGEAGEAEDPKQRLLHLRPAPVRY